MSSPGIRLAIEPVRSIAFGGISGTYAGIGTAIDNPAHMMYIVNATDALLMFSDDGVVDKFPIAASTSFILDINANKTTPEGFFLGKGRRIYVKQVGVPSTGNVYLSIFYSVV